ncbi:MAG: pyruvate kinase, partial [Chlamydiales bacterium]|nr:pyruvate kinase [Chlamydiales bacterium]
IELIQSVRKRKGKPLAIMLDTKGPEIRVDKIFDGVLKVAKGDKIVIATSIQDKRLPTITITPSNIVNEIELGKRVLFDDGYVAGKVIEKHLDKIILEIENHGSIQQKKGVNIPGSHFSTPAITEKDKEDLAFGARLGVDVIAASFVCNAEHVIDIKKILAENKAAHIKVIAKIESVLGIENFDTILHVADGIMVARGDLGVEIPITQVPRVQKEMINKSLQMSKPVIIATQMLQSMINNPRPTRAEVSDVANAIYDGASAVMLSGETAIGEFPIETVQIMHDIIKESEDDFDYHDYFLKHSKNDFFDISSSVAVACVKTAFSARAKAIIACTSSGTTAKIISRFKPKIPILAITTSEKVYHQLAYQWGVVPMFSKVDSFKAAVAFASCKAMQEKLLEYGDLVVITAGTPFGVCGSTNMVVVENIGDVLVRGHQSRGEKVVGKIAIFLSHDAQEKKHLQDKIVVLTKLEKDYFPLLNLSKAIILQNHPEDIDSINLAKEFYLQYNIPVLLKADGAIEVLKEGTQVTFDPQKGLIFRGTITDHQMMMNQLCPGI